MCSYRSLTSAWPLAGRSRRRGVRGVQDRRFDALTMRRTFGGIPLDGPDRQAPRKDDLVHPTRYITELRWQLNASRSGPAAPVLDTWFNATPPGRRCRSTDWSPEHEEAASLPPSNRKGNRHHHSLMNPTVTCRADQDMSARSIGQCAQQSTEP